MNVKYGVYIVPGLGALCVLGAIAVGISARAPMAAGVAVDDSGSYAVRVPENLEPGNNIPTMEQVVEKHLFVKERKATGQNTFPDLLVKGIYVGAESSAVFSLKYRPEANVRVWMGDVDSVINNITNPRDPRKPIVDFLSEWDIKEITFKGVTVEHIITGEVETYMVDYTPTKHAKDNSETGYGQGMLAQNASGAPKTSKTSSQPAAAKTQLSNQQRAQAMTEFRNMVQKMTPEQRARLAERIKGDGGQRGSNQDQNTQRNSSNSSSRNSSSRNSGSSARSGR